MTVNHRTVCTTEKSWPRYVETTECDCTLNQTCPGTFFIFYRLKARKIIEIYPAFSRSYNSLCPLEGFFFLQRWNRPCVF